MDPWVPARRVERDLAQRAQHDHTGRGSGPHTRQLCDGPHDDDEAGGHERPPAQVGVRGVLHQELACVPARHHDEGDRGTHRQRPPGTDDVRDSRPTA